MSQPKDLNEQMPSKSDLLLVDLLYGELDDEQRAQASEAMESDDLQREFEAFSDIRSLFRELPEHEPPAALTAKLLHAAALHAPAQAAEPADGSESAGIMGWLSRLFRPILMYPGLAAAASLVLVVVAAGTFYMTGRARVAEPQLTSAPSEPAVASPESAERLPVDSIEVTGQADNLDRALDLDSALGLNDKRSPLEAEELGESGSVVFRKTESKRADDDTSRIARPYEGDVIGKKTKITSKATPRATKSATSKPATGSGGAAAGLGGAGSFQSAKDSTRSPDIATAPEDIQATPPRTEPTADAVDDMGAADEAAAPEPSRPADKPASRGNKSEDAGSFSERQRIRSLHDEARSAASRGDCKTVNEVATMIRNQDATYYRESFRKDKALAKCLSLKTP